MIGCTWHDVCAGGFVQGPADVDTILRCMEARGVLRRTVRGKYVTSRTSSGVRTLAR